MPAFSTVPSNVGQKKKNLGREGEDVSVILCPVCGSLLKDRKVELLGRDDLQYCSAFCAVTFHEWTGTTEKVSLYQFYLRKRKKAAANGREPGR